MLALTNTIAFGALLGEFRFVWPEGVDPYIADPTPLLAESFRRQFEFTEEDLHGRTVLPEGEIVFGDHAGMRERLAGLNEHVLVDEPRPLCDRSAHSTTTRRRLTRRFREAFFSNRMEQRGTTARGVIIRLERRRDHLGTARRAGDIVFLGRLAPTGSTRLTATVHAASLYIVYTPKVLSRRAGLVLTFSDDAMLLRLIAASLLMTSSGAADVIPGYDGLPMMLQALADILLMSRCGSSLRAFREPRSARLRRTSVVAA